MQGVCQTDLIMLFAQELLIHITKQCDPEWFLRMVLGSWAISRKVVEACVEDSSTIFQNSPALCTQYTFRHISQWSVPCSFLCYLMSHGSPNTSRAASPSHLGFPYAIYAHPPPAQAPHPHTFKQLVDGSRSIYTTSKDNTDIQGQYRHSGTR